MAEKQAVTGALQAAQLHMHLANRKPAVVGSLGAALIVAWVMDRAASRLDMASWLAAIVAVVVLRLCVAAANQARVADPTMVPGHWLVWHQVSAALHGVAWGMAGVLLYPGDEPSLKAFLALVLAGVSVSGALLVALDTRAVVSFVLPVLLPITVRMCFAGGVTDIATGALIAVYGVFVVVMARMAQSRQMEHLLLRVEEGERAARLRSSEELLARTSEIARVGGWEVDRDRATRITPQVRLIHALPMGAPPRQLFDHYSVEHRQMLRDAADRAFADAKPFVLELPSTTGDGREIWVRVVGHPEIENGVVVRLRGVTQDITERKSAEIDLQESIGQMRAVVDSVTEAIMIVDHDCEVCMANRAAERLFGRSGGDLVGCDARGLLSLEPCQRPSQSEGPCTPSAEVRRRQVNSVGGDGAALTLELTSVGVSWQQELSSVWVLRDVTEQTKLQHALREAARNAEQASRAKTDFLANMSHEIRTPLNGMLGMVELLGTMSLTSEQQVYVTALRRSGRLLMSVLNDVLDLSKIESGQFKLDVKTFALYQALQLCVDLMTPAASKKGLTLRLEIDPRTPKFVMGDAMRLQQVLNNLLSNAIKFTSAGGAWVRAEPAPELSASAIRISVADSGPGIDPERRRSLFQPFSQGDSSTARRYGGTGLGLVIARRIVEAMDGSISVESQPGQGAIFVFTANLAPSDTPAEAEKLDSSFGGFSALQGARPTQRHAPLRVLLAEDNPVNRLYAEAVLHQLGCETEVVEDGEGAVQALMTKGPFDLILMDLQMPGIDGLEATRQIRALERKQGIQTQRIVALTASALPDDHQRCIASGMSGLMSKPFTIDDMRSLLAHG